MPNDTVILSNLTPEQIADWKREWDRIAAFEADRGLTPEQLADWKREWYRIGALEPASLKLLPPTRKLATLIAELRALAEPKITLDQVAVLIAVAGARMGRRSVRDIAARLDMPKPAVTRHIARLAELKLVSKERHEGDDRLVDVHLTLGAAELLGKLAALTHTEIEL